MYIILLKIPWLPSVSIKKSKKKNFHAAVHWEVILGLLFTLFYFLVFVLVAYFSRLLPFFFVFLVIIVKLDLVKFLFVSFSHPTSFLFHPAPTLNSAVYISSVSEFRGPRRTSNFPWYKSSDCFNLFTIDARQLCETSKKFLGPWSYYLILSPGKYLSSSFYWVICIFIEVVRGDSRGGGWGVWVS